MTKYLMGIISGIVIIAIVLVGGGFIILTQEGMMKTVEDSIGSSIGMDLDEEQEQLSILEYGQNVLSILGKISESPISDIEKVLGITMISKTISDAVGIEASVISESSISNLGATLTDNLTIKIMQEKFEVELPDFPLFQDEEFLQKPVSEAFGSLDEYHLDAFIDVVYDGEGTEENPESSAILQKLGKKTIKEVSEETDAIIDDTQIGEVIDVTPDSSEVLKYLEDKKIGDLDAAIDAMTINDVMTIDEESSLVLQYLSSYKDENDEPCTINKLDMAIDDMTIGDAIEINEDSSEVLKFLEDKKLDEIDGAIQTEMKLQDAIKIDEDSNGVLKYLAPFGINELDAAIPNMPLSSALDPEDDNRVIKFLTSYVDEEGNPATLDTIGSAIDAMTLGDAIEITESSSKVLQYLKGTTLNGIDGKIKIMPISEAVNITEDSHAVMKAIADLTLEDLGKGSILQSKIDGLKLNEVMVVGENPHPILREIQDLTIEQLADKDALQERIDKVELGEIITITPSSTKILRSLEGVQIGDLATTIEGFTIKDVLEDYDIGVLSLIDPETTFQQVGKKAATAVTHSSIYALNQAGVFNNTLDTSSKFENLISRINRYNSTPDAIVDDFAHGKTESAITHSVFLKVGDTVTNTDFRDKAAYQNGMVGINRIGYKGEMQIDALSGITVIDGAYVLTPEIVDAIFLALGLSDECHSVILFVDQGINLTFATGNYEKNVSVMYDVNNATTQGTLSFEEGVGNYTDVGGCTVYAADSIKVMENGVYVDYVLGSDLPIETKKAYSAKDEGGNKIGGPNVWISAYYEYQV